MGGQPNGNAVRRHLDDILASPGFARSKRLGAFLSFVVKRAVDGDAGAISERNIAIQVYGRPADFDPKVDGIVRAEAIRLRHKLREFYEPAPEGGPRIEIPKGGYVPVFTGFEQAVVSPPVEVSLPRPRAWAVAPFVVLAVVAVLAAAAGWRYVVGSAGPVNVSKMVAEANARRLVGDEFGALALLDQAIAIDANSVDAHSARAGIFEYLGHLKDAHAEIDRAEELAARQGLERPEIALEAHALDGDFVGTMQRLQEMMNRRPKDLGLFIELLRRELSPDAPKESLLAVKESLRLARQLPGAAENPELDRYEALWLGRLGKNKEAIEVVMRGERKAAAMKASFSLGRMLALEGGLRQNDGQEECILTLERARNWCLSWGDDFCVAITYRVDGNRLLVYGQYDEALRNYRRGMAIVQRRQNWPEMGNLIDGVDEAVKHIDPQLTATDFLRSRFEVFSERRR